MHLITEKYGIYDVARIFAYRDNNYVTLKNCSRVAEAGTAPTHGAAKPREPTDRKTKEQDYPWPVLEEFEIYFPVFTCSYKLPNFVALHLPDHQCVLASANNFHKNVTESTEYCYEYHITIRDKTVTCYPAHRKECSGKILWSFHRSCLDWTMRDWSKRRCWF
jgi:hypothetical protein